MLFLPREPKAAARSEAEGFGQEVRNEKTHSFEWVLRKPSLECLSVFDRTRND